LNCSHGAVFLYTLCRKLSDTDQGEELYRLLCEEFDVHIPRSKLCVRSKDATVADYKKPPSLQGVEDLKVVANFMALLRVVSPEFYVTKVKKAKKKRSNSSNSDSNSDGGGVRKENNQNKKQNEKVKKARDALVAWRNEVYDLVPDAYQDPNSNPNVLHEKEKRVSKLAGEMHAAFKNAVKKVTPYVHHCQHTCNYRKRDVCKGSAEGHEHQNKSLKSDGELTTKHKIGMSDTRKSVTKTILVANSARKEAATHVAVPLSQHERRLVLMSRQMRTT
jgi:hypothetical protein